MNIQLTWDNGALRNGPGSFLLKGRGRGRERDMGDGTMEPWPLEIGIIAFEDEGGREMPKLFKESKK